jgi:alpha-tubulin suppressor-like RCC1 family protein
MIGAARLPARPPAARRLRRPHRWVRLTALALLASIVPVVPSVLSSAPVAADPADGWIQVSTGQQYACGIDGDERAWCWGQDSFGVLGNGDVLTSTMHAPSLVDAPGVRFASISAGSSHACAVDTTGVGWCWGNDASGQLGEGPGGEASRPSPVQVTGTQRWETISAGGGFTCGIDSGRALYCWGRDLDGELGNGTPLTNQSSPVQVAGSGWTDITTGDFHACGRAGGSLQCWGRGDNGRVGDGGTADVPSPTVIDPPTGTSWASASAGLDHTCATTATGALWCWGRDNRGQLGNGATTTTDQVKPISVPGNTWDAIDAGRFATCGIDASGVSWCWGIDANRELGNGPALSGDQAAPTLVDLPSGEKYATISMGGTVSCGTLRGDILCAGTRTNGAVGDGGTTGFVESPASVAKTKLDQVITFATLPDRVFGTGAFSVSATASSGLPVSFAGGGACTVAGSTITIRDLGTCSITASQAGNGDYRPAPSVNRTFTITPATSTGTWSQVDGGSEHTCAVTTGGEAWCWGRDEFGQLGNGPTDVDDQQAPTPVAPPASGGVVWEQVSAGDEHSCGVTTDGRGFCWGRDLNGRLGDGGGATDSAIPAEVGQMGASPWVSISAGGSHTCGLTEEGAAYCWGASIFGQLGNGGATGDRFAPYQVSHPGGDVGWTDISTGLSHTCASDTDAKSWCWGGGSQGQLGAGPGGASQSSPVAVAPSISATQTEVIDVEVAWNRSCHRQVISAGVEAGPNARLWCWGDGTGSQAPATTSDLDILGAGVGLDHRCSVATDAVIRCSGNNTAGQSGAGPTNPTGNGPIAAAPGVGWRAVTAGAIHSCGISTTGTLYCWGYDNHGQIGNGPNDVPTPSTDPNVRWLPTPVYLPTSGGGELRVTTSPALPSLITVDGEPRDVWGLTWLEIDAGDHEVCFSAVVGYATPACQTVNVPVGGTGTATGVFQPLVSLQVSTSPAVPATITVNGVPRDNWGLFTWVPANQALEVCFSAVAGFNPPPCQTVPAGSVQAGTPISLTGNYAANGAATGQTGKGLLRVTSSPPVPATISVNGTPRDDWGLDWLQVDPGSYEVCFSHVLGYATPACQTVTVTAGQTTTAVGQFTQLGWIQASTAPPSEKTITFNGVARNDWGAWPPVAPGPHQVCFTRFATTPLCKVVQVTAGQTTTVDDT